VEILISLGIATAIVLCIVAITGGAIILVEHLQRRKIRLAHEKYQKEQQEARQKALQAALTPHQVVTAALQAPPLYPTTYDMISSMNKKKLNCANCGKEITVNKYARNTSYCSDECKDSYNENNYLI